MWNWTHFPKCPPGETFACRCPHKACHKSSARPKPLRRACPHSCALQNPLAKPLRTYHHHHYQAPPAPWIPTRPLKLWTMARRPIMKPSSSVLGVQVPARCHTLAGPRRATRFLSRGQPSSDFPSAFICGYFDSAEEWLGCVLLLSRPSLQEIRRANPTYMDMTSAAQRKRKFKR